LKNLSVFTLSVLISGLLFLQACNESKSGVDETILLELEALQKELVPDRRIAVFNVISSEESDKIIVETDQPIVIDTLTSRINSNSVYAEKIQIHSLPSEELGEQIYGVVRVSVANLRREPRHQAELIDQAVMGSEFRILKQQGGWYYIQTPWDYLGWVTGESFTRMTREQLETDWKSKDRVRVTAVDTRIFEAANITSGVISDVTLGGELRLVNRGTTFSEVALSDGRTGFVPTSQIGSVIKTDNNISPSGEKVIQTAIKFHGLPYLWGGNSGKGFDCSGFTQTVFKENGYLLPRDANMQVKIGEEVSIEDNFAHLEPGDLIYFGSNNRITHVGISLGGPKFIHASSYVMINSLDPADHDYTEYRRNTLQVVKRVR
jgi:gamma-D-glutamyl-L-lysine dipeptidyl-peptidase